MKMKQVVLSAVLLSFIFLMSHVASAEDLELGSLKGRKAVYFGIAEGQFVSGGSTSVVQLEGGFYVSNNLEIRPGLTYAKISFGDFTINSTGWKLGAAYNFVGETTKKGFPYLLLSFSGSNVKLEAGGDSASDSTSDYEFGGGYKTLFTNNNGLFIQATRLQPAGINRLTAGLFHLF